MKWSYHSIKLPDPCDLTQFEILGKDGWELVCVFCQRGEVAIAYFKRELKK